MTTNSPTQIVYTNAARCRDCYRCVRVCPVKAIRLKDGQAFVDEKRCISCGTCIRECPQGAKTYRHDLETAKSLVEDYTVAVSIAPSYAAIFPDWQRKRLASALRKLGFTYISETAVGAYLTAKKTIEYASSKDDMSHICTACPAVVNYVEKYNDAYLNLLVPVVSPMMAHATFYKEKYGDDIKVVFIGPCVAKKAEAQREELASLVDCVLTFEELFMWLEQAGINLKTCEESDFDDYPPYDARFYPIEGGWLKTANCGSDRFDTTFLCVSGFEAVEESLKTVAERDKPCIVEPLLCPHGCINGPGIHSQGNLFIRRTAIIEHATERDVQRITELPETKSDLHTEFTNYSDDVLKNVSQAQVREVLEKTGKLNEEDQLNCGACGYGTCRQQAIAVVQGMAEIDMCIPFMRRLAEQRSDRILETSPNGMVIVDEELRILTMNPAFRKMFLCSENIYGKNISRLMDPEHFIKVISGKEETVNVVVHHQRYGLICHQVFYMLQEERQIVGIFLDITRSHTDHKRLEELKAKTILQARELYEHQIGMASEFARFLGEYTAKGEKLIDNLMQLNDNPQEGVD